MIATTGAGIVAGVRFPDVVWAWDCPGCGHREKNNVPIAPREEAR